MPAAGQFFSVTPAKVLDTRDGTGGVPATPLAAGAMVSFPVVNVGAVPDTASDVYVVISAFNPSQSGALEDYDTDWDNPQIFTVPFSAGENRTVSDLVQVGSDGYVSLTNASSGTTDVSVTVIGYVQSSSTDQTQPAGKTYAPLPYGGVLDTRSGLGAPAAQIPAGGSVTVQVTGRVGVPADAAGAGLYIGASNASATGYVTAFPAGGTDNGLRVLSYEPQHIERNFVSEPLSSSGQITLVNHGSAPVDLMAAVQGYLVSPSSSEAGDAFSDVTPARIADTRNGTGGVPAAPVPAGGSITFTATGVDGIPSAGVPAVAESVAAANPTANGYLSVYPAGGTDPQNAVVNFNASDGQVNDLTAPLVSAVSPTGQETITNHSSGTVDVIVAARGYYTAPTVPVSDVQTDAGVQNGTATVKWMAPITDGGAAITSYSLTLYNPDGSVAQTASYGPSTYSATLTGLTGSGTYSVGVAAMNAVGTGDIATVPVQDSTGSAAQGYQQVSGPGLDMSFDPTNDSISLASVTAGSNDTYDSSGNILSSQTINQDTSTVWTGLTPDANANPTCYKKTVQNSNVLAVRTFYNAWQGNSWSLSWLNQVYEVKNARQKVDANNNKYWTRQYQYCVTGGGDVHNSYHQWFDGHAATIAQQGSKWIARTGGTGVVPGTATISTALNFALAVGKATIGAQVNVNPRSGPGGGDYKWDIGRDGRFPNYPSSWANYWENRNNTFYVAPHNYVWDGSGDYQGNTSHSVYEFHMSYTAKVHFLGWPALRAFCAKAGGVGCAPFN